MIIGLDISTSITGVTILDSEGDVLLNDHWDFKNCNTFIEKIELAKKNIEGLYYFCEENGILEAIYIEQSLQAFRPGLSSAKTLLTLAKFNGILSWLLYDCFGIEPEYLAATSARKNVGITVPKGEKAKKVVLDFVVDNEKWFVIEYTKNGSPKPFCFDRADSWVIARAGFLDCQQKKKK